MSAVSSDAVATGGGSSSSTAAIAIGTAAIGSSALRSDAAAQSAAPALLTPHATPLASQQQSPCDCSGRPPKHTPTPDREHGPGPGAQKPVSGLLRQKYLSPHAEACIIPTPELIKMRQKQMAQEVQVNRFQQKIERAAAGSPSESQSSLYSSCRRPPPGQYTNFYDGFRSVEQNEHELYHDAAGGTGAAAAGTGRAGITIAHQNSGHRPSASASPAPAANLFPEPQSRGYATGSTPKIGGASSSSSAKIVQCQEKCNEAACSSLYTFSAASSLFPNVSTTAAVPPAATATATATATRSRVFDSESKEAGHHRGGRMLESSAKRQEFWTPALHQGGAAGMGREDDRNEERNNDAKSNAHLRSRVFDSAGPRSEKRGARSPLLVCSRGLGVEEDGAARERDENANEENDGEAGDEKSGDVDEEGDSIMHSASPEDDGMEGRWNEEPAAPG